MGLSSGRSQAERRGWTLRITVQRRVRPLKDVSGQQSEHALSKMDKERVLFWELRPLRGPRPRT